MKTSHLFFGVASAALAVAAVAGGAQAQAWPDQGFSISGRTYMDVSNGSLEVNGAKTGSKNGFGFDVKRVYFQVDKKFNDLFSAQLQTDVSQVNQASGSAAGQGLYVKKAFVKASFSPKLEVSLGSNEMPWVPYAESIYGNRYLENTVLEQDNTGKRTTFGTSADWGVHVGGKLNDIFSYQVSMVNGGGYRNSGRSKTMDFEGRLSAKFDQWNFAIGGYNGKRAQSVYKDATLIAATPTVPAHWQQNLAATPRTATRMNALAAYVGDRGKVGVEYFSASNWDAKSILGTQGADKADGASVFGSYRVTPLYTVFARVDAVKPSKTLAPFNKDSYYNIGIQTVPLKGITLSLVAKHDRMDQFAVSGPATALVKGARTRYEFTEIGIFTEIRY